jgi:tyrocidine synthetase III
MAERLNGKMNCFGLLYTIGNGVPAYQGIEEMAKGFADEIIKTTVEDEIVIVGYSMGALVAFEITKELERKMRKVRLVLLDRNLRSTVNENVTAGVSGQALDNIFNEELSPWLAFIDANDIENFRKLFFHHLNLIGRYMPKGRVEADVLACEAGNGKIKTKMYGWEQYTSGNFKHVYLSGTHADVLSGANQQKITDMLMPAVKEVHEPAFS